MVGGCIRFKLVDRNLAAFAHQHAVIARFVEHHKLIIWRHVGKNGVRVAHVFAGATDWANQKVGGLGVAFWVVANQV